MRLLRVELNRLRWRRAVLLLVGLCVLLPAVIWASTAWDTRPISHADMAAAQAQAERDARQPWVAEELQRCLDNPEQYGGPAVDPSDVEEMCRQSILPTADSYLWRDQLDLVGQVKQTGTGVFAILAALLLLVGTTYVGHDWNTGSMGNQLLFEPRRGRLWATKAAAVGLVGLVVGGLVLTAYWTAMTGLAASRGLPHGDPVPGAVVAHVGWGTLLCGAAAVLGYALSTLFRSTVATLGVVFVISVAGTFLGVALFGEEAQRWLLPTNAVAVVQGGYEYWVDEAMYCDPVVAGSSCGWEEISRGAGLAYVGVVLAAVGAASTVSFRRRDIP